MPFTIQAFGSNGSGQLALGHEQDVSTPNDCTFADGQQPSSRPMSIACGGNHTLLLCEDGAVYAAGANDNGRCGVEAASENLKNFQRVHFRDYAGELLDDFKYIAATWESSTFVASNGAVFTSGSGNSGELGQGPGVNMASVPRAVLNFPPKGVDIVAVAACMRHTVVVLSNGHVYGWGAGRKGQLGEPREKAIWSPRRLVPFTTKTGESGDFYAVRAVCGRDFTYVLGKGGGSYSIFGADGSEKLIAFAPDPAPAWADIAATWKGIHGLTEDGSVWGWGSSRVPADSPPLKAIAAGSEHVLAETADGKILASGWGEHGNCGPNVDDNSLTKGWAEIGTGKLLGAGCATSWMLDCVVPSSQST